MASCYWSAENATKAFLKTLRMGQNTKEPDEAEFISALAAGNNAQLMVLVASTDYVTNYNNLTALSAAAYQTNSRIICIFATRQDYQASMLDLELCNTDFVVGHPQTLLFRNYKDADFVLVDCENTKTYEKVVDRMLKRSDQGAVVVGYNALCKDSAWQLCRFKTAQLLPIGRGLLVTRIPTSSAKSLSSIQNNIRDDSAVDNKKNRSRWVVKVDQCTGEEHVFRVRIPQGN